ncbi:MAG TPA: hypothetical protein VHH90_01160 [Polyangia bacterium]|nr:hypothetical protein [Polyangia bacterium]
MTLSAVTELGEKIDRAWRKVNFDLSAFPELCATSLETAQLPDRIDPADLVQAVFAGRLPAQADPRALFGEPPVTLFRAPRFYIDALFWVDGTTSIHDHSFSGAFQVLSGSSIETTFSFDRRHDIGGHFLFGDLTVRGSALRRRGNVRAIPAGPGYIHSLFHLARPSVSLVVRTRRDPNVGAQMEYAPPGLAYDSFMEDPGRDRMLQVVDMLRKTENPAFEETVGALIASLDSHAAFSIIQTCTRNADTALVDRLIDRVSNVDHASKIRGWVHHRRRIDFLITRRRLVREDDLRFFIAVLLNAQRRSDALAVVAQFAPAIPPEKQVAQWLRRLSETTMRFRLDNAELQPNVLGLPTFHAGYEQVVEDILCNKTRSAPPEVEVFVRDLKRLPPLMCLFVE